MSGYYSVLACAPSGDLVRFLLAFRLAGIRETASAVRRVPERFQRKVTTIMDRPRHVIPLAMTPGPSRHRWHVRAVAAVMAAGLALVLAALVTRTALLFWAGYGLAALTWTGGLLWCRRHSCHPSAQRDEP